MIGKRGKRTFFIAAVLLTAVVSTGALAVQRGGESARPATVAAPLNDASLVYLYVSLTDQVNTPIAGLGPADFQVFEDGQEQKIAEFTVDTAPVSVGIVWGPNIPVGNTIVNFVRACPPNTEYFVVSNDTVVAPFTTDMKKIPRVLAESDLELFPSGGKDSIHIGLDVLSEAAAYVRRVLLVVGRTQRANPVARPAFGNGATYESLTKTAVRNDMQIYTIGVDGTATANLNVLESANINPSGRTGTPGIGGGFGAPGVQTGRMNSGIGLGIGSLSINGADFLGQNSDEGQDVIELQRMAEMTGGRSFYVQNTDTGIGGNDTGELEDTAQRIAHGLQMQYRIGYRPTNTTKDGKWRSIDVRLNAPVKGNMWTKSGYYVAKEPKKK